MTYKMAGVNIGFANEVKSRIRKLAKLTYNSHVIGDASGFAGLFSLQSLLEKYRHPVLVQTIDGIGTKTIIAKMMNKYDTLGYDLLSANCNDILVTGATPITMLDCIASDRLGSNIVEQIVLGMVEACREHHVALIGGETAEMPNIYLRNEYDLIGTVTGIVEKDKIINGSSIAIGDQIIGLRSDGLHTNGYSLARKLFFEIARLEIDSIVPELSSANTLGEILLKKHLNYTKPILDILNTNVEVKGMAHITGGGLLGNITRILPTDCMAKILTNCWQAPPVFQVMQKIGHVSQMEMFRTFNMGIGYVLVVAAEYIPLIMQLIRANHPGFQAEVIGEITKGNSGVQLVCE